ncbi:MAG: GntR family transcriptional regulator [Collinsella sp.]|nr:GntR family transcriptional regulator [Collinsella sp.]
MNRVVNETLHGRVSNYIRSKIYAKEWGPGNRIPSEHDLMDEFEVSRGTVRKAIKTLVDEGLLEQEHGRGTFVCEPHIAHPGGDRPFSFAASLGEQGIAFKTEVLFQERIPASGEVAERLQIAEGDPVLRLRRVRSTGGKPIMVLDSWTPLDVCPGLDEMPLETMPLFEAVERCSGARIMYSHMAYSARAAGKDLASVMDVAENSPVLNLEQLIVLDDGRPVEWGDTMLCVGQTIVGTARQRDEDHIDLPA